MSGKKARSKPQDMYVSVQGLGSVGKPKSQRTTFSLTEKSLQIIEARHAFTGKSKKQIFNELLVLHETTEITLENLKGLLNEININLNLGTIKKSENSDVVKIRKTFLLEKHTLQRLNELSKKYKVDRDYLVNILILHYDIFNRQQSKNAVKHLKYFVKRANTINEELWALHYEMIKRLGEDHYKEVLWENYFSAPFRVSDGIQDAEEEIARLENKGVEDQIASGGGDYGVD